MNSYTGGHNADKRTTMKNQNRSAALGRPAIKSLGGGGGVGGGGSAALGRPAIKSLGGGLYFQTDSE